MRKSTILLKKTGHYHSVSMPSARIADFQQDLAPVTTVALAPNVLVVNPRDVVTRLNTEMVKILTSSPP